MVNHAGVNIFVGEFVGIVIRQVVARDNTNPQLVSALDNRH